MDDKSCTVLQDLYHGEVSELCFHKVDCTIGENIWKISAGSILSSENRNNTHFNVYCLVTGYRRDIISVYDKDI